MINREKKNRIRQEIRFKKKLCQSDRTETEGNTDGFVYIRKFSRFCLSAD